MAKAAAIFLSSFIAGGLIAWASLDRPPSAPKAELRKSERTSAAPPPIRSREDLVRDADEWIAKTHDYSSSPLQDMLGDWTDDEVRAALEQSLGDPFVPDGSWMPDLLFMEYLRRDLDQALAWYTSVPSRARMAELLSTLGRGWPEDRAADGLAFLLANRDLFSGHIIGKNLASAAKEGPAAVLEMIRSMQKKHLSVSQTMAIGFPEDFDFPSLLNSLPEDMVGKTVSTRAITSWYQQDREAAFRWLLENREDTSLRGLFYFTSPEKRPEALGWVGGKLADLPEDQRKRILLGTVAQSEDLLHDARLVMAGTNDPEMREEVRTAAAAYLGSKPHEVIALLEEMEDPGWRLEILETAPMPTRLGGANEAYIRQRLGDWKTPADRIETIIRNLKQ